MLRNLFHCDFSTNATEGFLNFLQSHLNWYKLNSWAFLQCPKSTDHQHTNCLNPSTQKRICSKAKLNIIKTVRSRLKDVKGLLNVKNLKIIVLHRDPRGVMNSRVRKHWCTSNSTLLQLGNKPSEFF